MFCRNCGSEMRDDAKFCPNCGTLNSSAAGSSPEESSFRGTSEPVWPGSGEQSWNTAPQPDAAGPAGGGRKRRGLGLMIGGGVAAVAVIALLVVTVSGLFSSPKNRVEKAVNKTISAYSDANKKLEMPDVKKLREDKSVSGRISVELNSINSSLVGYDLSDLYGLGVQMSANYDGKDRKMDAQLSAFWDDDEIAAVQMLADGAKLYFGSPQFTGSTFVGMNTETLGADLADLTGDDSVEDLSFNIFDLMDIATRMEDTEELDKAIKDANKALLAEMEIEKTGSKTMDINGKDTKTTAYHVVIPQDALEDYVDALEDILSSIDYVSMYEETFEAIGMPQDEIDYIMSDLYDMDIYGELADGVKYALDELGDVELDVYLSGGYVSAVIYEEKIEGTKVEIGLYLGGENQYVDDLSLEIKAGEDEIVMKSTGNHSGKGGSYTDKTTISIRESGSSLGRLSSDLEYEPGGKGNNFHWEISVDSSGAKLGSLEMEGQLTTTKDSLDLKLEDASVRAMGMEIFSLGIEYYIGPCDGMDVSVKSPTMIADMDEEDVLALLYDIENNAEDWAYDMEDLFGSRISEELLWQLMYAF